MRFRCCKGAIQRAHRLALGSLGIALIFQSALCGPSHAQGPPASNARQFLHLDVHGVGIKIPMLGGHCRMDTEAQPFDKRAMGMFPETMPAFSLKLVAATMLCDRLEQARAGKAGPATIAVYLTTAEKITDPTIPDRKEFSEAVCAEARSAATETPTKNKAPLAKAKELHEIGKAGKDEAGGVLLVGADACFTAGVEHSTGLDTQEHVHAKVIATTLIKGQYIAVGILSIGLDALPTVYQRSRAIVGDLVRANAK